MKCPFHSPPPSPIYLPQAQRIPFSVSLFFLFYNDDLCFTGASLTMGSLSRWAERRKDPSSECDPAFDWNASGEGKEDHSTPRRRVRQRLWEPLTLWTQDCKPTDTERSIMLMNYTKSGLNYESFNCLGGKRRGPTRKGAESNGSVACTFPFSST